MKARAKLEWLGLNELINERSSFILIKKTWSTHCITLTLRLTNPNQHLPVLKVLFLIKPTKLIKTNKSVSNPTLKCNLNLEVSFIEVGTISPHHESLSST